MHKRTNPLANRGDSQPRPRVNGPSSFTSSYDPNRFAESTFVVPQEAPVFSPTEEEFKEPLQYIARIRPIAEKFGICRIKPPENWCPPFCVDVDKLRFTPRIQRLNELEAKTRIKLNFLDQIAKFWELQGSTLRLPVIDRKVVDLYSLHHLVKEGGGYEAVSKNRKWSELAGNMGYPRKSGSYGAILKGHYERILYPYDIFNQGKTEENKITANSETGEATKPTDQQQGGELTMKSGKSDLDYKPHEIVSRQAIQPPPEKQARRMKRICTHSQFPHKKNNEQVDGVEENEGENKELRRLQFHGAGPKMAGYNRSADKNTPKKLAHAIDPLAKYICQNCGRGDVEEEMLLCDGCDDSYHTFCLVPPLSEVPEGDWRCPKCVAEEVSKPTEAFGFEQAQREYTLFQFGEMADQFKQEYFNMPVVPSSVVESEFWRIVSSIDEDVTVEYGADLHTMDHGSGFPTKNAMHLSGIDQEYATDGWNLNNLPVLQGSVLGYINADISGMKIPWMYVGMCFATFCWHNEDHWSYSINYLHWGEAKTWYGVPGSSAELFEQTMKKAASELFDSQPDLLHQLVTIMNPNILMRAGVPVCRTDQSAGEFVITFPRAYHAGFNQGFNFAEAVNFAPADWMRMGRECINHYSKLRRFCVFSHDELVCKMGLDMEKLDSSVAVAVHMDMVDMVLEEKQMRKALLEWGVTEAEREAFELLPDDERQCAVCKTTCFLSALTCSCSKDTLVCLRHYTMLCDCPAYKHTLRYRYTLDEFVKMLQKLKAKTESFDIWLKKVRESFGRNQPRTLTIDGLRELINEANTKKFPQCELLDRLRNTLKYAEKCLDVIQRFERINKGTRSNKNEQCFKVTMTELTMFVDECRNLPLVLKELDVIDDMIKMGEKFSDEATQMLRKPLPNLSAEVVQKCVDFGDSLFIDLRFLPMLKQRLEHTKWLAQLRTRRESRNLMTIEEVKSFMEQGLLLRPHDHIANMVAELKLLHDQAVAWEADANKCVDPKSPSSIGHLEMLLKQAQNLEIIMPSEKLLQDTYLAIQNWCKSAAALKTIDGYPHFETIQSLVVQGQKIPINLPELHYLEQMLNSARAWKERLCRTFLFKDTAPNITEVLCPRLYEMPKFDPSMEGNEAQLEVLNAYRRAELKEAKWMKEKRSVNESKDLDDPGEKFCVCNRKPYGMMLKCNLCLTWCHSNCVALPKNFVTQKTQILQLPAVTPIREYKFLCQQCMRTRRPRLDTILSLLVALQKLCVRLVEGDALQCVTERAMSWQDRARQVLNTPEMTKVLRRITSASNKLKATNTTQKSSQQVESRPSTSTADPDDEWIDISETEVIGEHAYSSYKPIMESGEDSDFSITLSEPLLKQIIDLAIEGDLIEVTIDESLALWKIITATKFKSEYFVFLEFSPRATPAILPAPKGGTKGKKRKLDEIEQRKLVAKRIIAAARRHTKRKKNKEVNSDEDECAAAFCLLPSGKEVDWIQCDKCNKWYHMDCVNLTRKSLIHDVEYVCKKCKGPAKIKPLPSSSRMSSNASSSVDKDD